MTLCHCCEEWVGHSLGLCDRAADYCPRCLLCDTHCPCDPVPAVAADDPGVP